MNRLTWTHPKRGFFRRADGKGVVNHVGPRDWSALIVNEGGRIQPVGNGHTAAQAMTFVDQAAPPCATCEGSGRMCGYHGAGDCECGGLGLPGLLGQMNCPKLPAPELLRRPANALNVEIGQPMTRCRLKTPEHWGDADPEGARWRLSGGSPLVFGPCTPNACPLKIQAAKADWEAGR